LSAFERRGQLLEIDALAAVAAREAERAVTPPAGHENGERAALRESARGQLTGLAGADDHHRPPGEAAELLLSELDRDRREAQPPLRDGGLGAHPLARRKRRLEQVVGERPGELLSQCGLVGALDLTLDLSLAYDHRLEPRGHAIQVARGVAVA